MYSLVLQVINAFHHEGVGEGRRHGLFQTTSIKVNLLNSIMCCRISTKIETMSLFSSNNAFCPSKDKYWHFTHCFFHQDKHAGLVFQKGKINITNNAAKTKSQNFDNPYWYNPQQTG